jgi:hypothetical protein
LNWFKAVSDEIIAAAQSGKQGGHRSVPAFAVGSARRIRLRHRVPAAAQALILAPHCAQNFAPLSVLLG